MHVWAAALDLTQVGGFEGVLHHRMAWQQHTAPEVAVGQPDIVETLVREAPAAVTGGALRFAVEQVEPAFGGIRDCRRITVNPGVERGRAGYDRAFVCRDGVGNGYALVSTLTVGDEVVATLLGIRNGARYVMIRISNAGEKWSNCSPGRLIIERTMAALHKDGVREFDFSIGNYAYKRRFGVTHLPLIDISAALSARGWPYALRDRAVRALRNYPRLDARLKRIFGKPLSREEN